MDFYELLARHFSESIRSAVGLSKEEERNLAQSLMKEASVQTLEKIWTVLDDDTLDDPTCFKKIEKIVEAYESLGTGAGSRHDFG